MTECPNKINNMKWYTITDYIFGMAFFILTMMQTSPLFVLAAFISSLYFAKAIKGMSVDEFTDAIKTELT